MSLVRVRPLFYAREKKEEEGKLSHLFVHLPELLSMAVILKGFPISASRRAQATSIVPSHLALNHGAPMRNKVRSFTRSIPIVLSLEMLRDLNSLILSFAY